MGRPPADEHLPEVVPHQPQPAPFPEVVPDSSPEAAEGQRYYMPSDKYPAYYDTAPKLPHEEPSMGHIGQDPYQQPWPETDPTVSAISPNSSVPWQSFPSGGDDQQTCVGSEPEREKRICGCSKRLFIIIAVIVGLVIVGAAVGGGVGGSMAARQASETASASGTGATGAAVGTTTATATASSTSSAPSPTITSLLDQTDPAMFQTFMFQAWQGNNFTGQRTDILWEEGYYNLGFNATSYIWVQEVVKCCLTFCADETNDLGWYCDARRRNATDDPAGFPRLAICTSPPTMLQSTHQLAPGVLLPLPQGWTEHKAPTGHTYYYNATTKESTYKRPSIAPPAAVPMPVPAAAPSSVIPAMTSYVQHQMVPQINLSDPAVANAFMAQYGQPQQQGQRGSFGAGGRGGFQPRPRPQPVDKPRSKVAIPDCEPWVLVYTKFGRRFVYNPVKNASYWRIPEKLMPAILELDKARIREMAEGKTPDQQGPRKIEEGAGKSASPPTEAHQEEAAHDYDSSEYEEVEVTDDEGAEDDDQDGEGGAGKRQRTEEPAAVDDGPAEFTEADIAAQLAAMGAEYDDIEMGERGDDGGWEEGDEGLPLSDEDARELFKDLLNDFGINPYSPWDKLMEEGKIFDDARYTVLPTTKARKEVWEEWSRAKIQQLKEQRAKEEKKDPRIPYMAFLQEKATPKLYWPEFRRKYKKEDAMKDPKLSDKDREKWYREHIHRLKLPQATLKADLKKLLESVPLSALNNQTLISHLPPQILADIRYISLDPKVRDPFVEAYIQGLGPPSETGEAGPEHEDEAARKARDERCKREKALEERERAVAEEKRRQEKKLHFERARLRDEERELERAMHVDKRGLQSQLVGKGKGE
ncbi:hypothetical protein N657DRAFT_684741 [Parathielavia appendiculata]|uniref:WW domain-containing protein n=1 Tax=Parathielavia appendiculata TaxID=2587402 RepID=A0AAN6TQX9_9PEZI|nr:hypothetical protein N657DRAFT_684741 [Parathielavia appendiculata]